MKLKRIFSLALGTALALSLVACGSNDNPAADNSKPGAVQPPSNYVDCDTLEEAIEMAGIEISIPEVIKGYDDCTFRANKTDGMIEVIFQNDDDEIRFRKGLGDEDISGNYNNFSEKNEVELDGTVITMKGTDGKVNVAVWSKDGYAYSIDCTTAVEKITMTDFAKTVMGEAVEPEGERPPSPFIPYDNMAEAAKMAGFDMTVPNTPDSIEAWEGYMIQALYGEDGADMLIRKAIGNEDISGDYNEYKQVENVDGVTLKGADGQFSLAMWTDGDYTYSISVGSALSQTDMMALVGGVK